jgi:hypothetical protein
LDGARQDAAACKMPQPGAEVAAVDPLLEHGTEKSPGPRESSGRKIQVLERRPVGMDVARQMTLTSRPALKIAITQTLEQHRLRTETPQGCSERILAAESVIRFIQGHRMNWIS